MDQDTHSQPRISRVPVPRPPTTERPRSAPRPPPACPQPRSEPARARFPRGRLPAPPPPPCRPWVREDAAPGPAPAAREDTEHSPLPRLQHVERRDQQVLVVEPGHLLPGPGERHPRHALPALQPDVCPASGSPPRAPGLQARPLATPRPLALRPGALPVGTPSLARARAAGREPRPASAHWLGLPHFAPPPLHYPSRVAPTRAVELSPRERPAPPRPGLLGRWLEGC